MSLASFFRSLFYIPQHYVVKEGDTLSGIAAQHYGDPNAYRAIFDANRGLLSDPDLIHPGQRLRIPAKP